MKKNTQNNKVLLKLENLTRLIITSIIPPDDVIIDIVEQNNRYLVHIDVPNYLKGALIGKSGHTIRAVRSVLEMASFKDSRPVILHILD